MSLILDETDYNEDLVPVCSSSDKPSCDSILPVIITRLITMKILFLFVLYLTSRYLTPCQSVEETGLCGSANNLPKAAVTETDLAGTHILKAVVSAGHSWTISLKTSVSSHGLKTFYETALGFVRPDGNNSLMCKYEANANDGSFCELELTRTMDLEFIQRQYKQIVIQDYGFSFIVLYQVECKESVQGSFLRYDLFLAISSVNEYAPMFRNSPVIVVVAKEDSGSGKELYDLTDSAQDADVGSDGHIVEIVISNQTDLIAIQSQFKVVLNRGITEDDLKSGNCLRFLLLALDGGRPSKSGEMTFVVNVEDEGQTDCSNEDSDKSGVSRNDSNVGVPGHSHTSGVQDSVGDNDGGDAGGLSSRNKLLTSIGAAFGLAILVAIGILAYRLGKRRGKRKAAAKYNLQEGAAADPERQTEPGLQPKASSVSDESVSEVSEASSAAESQVGPSQAAPQT